MNWVGYFNFEGLAAAFHSYFLRLGSGRHIGDLRPYRIVAVDEARDAVIVSVEDLLQAREGKAP